jgi:riboflavin synthase
MFTGIVEEVGTVAAVDRRPGGALLRVDCHAVLADLEVGASISVNGVCLTATTVVAARGFSADLMGETLERSGLGSLAPGDPVNLERALPANGRLGGHLVQGHVDGVGTVLAIDSGPEWTQLRVSLPASIAPYVVEKGSIAVDGTSLTVMVVDDEGFSVGLVPHTLAVTVLGRREVGDHVNLEVDVIAKYVERMLRRGNVI